ncbi:MAG TPA: SPFH domain-containing protein [Thermoanaerobaculia bacterium]|jgi:regulator of protease activity HflC (stomatin/prohibitin superfamily)|nr:SPFH domain-containing protein [Thermoanaerobaculia bacterium]
MVTERAFRPLRGWIPLVVFVALLLAVPFLFVRGAKLADDSQDGAAFFLISAVLCFLAALICLFGFRAIAPNDAQVFLLFGNYRGSVRTSGFYWVNPFYTKRKITLRVRNFETGTSHTPELRDAHGKVLQSRARTSSRPSKVNDREGNPIEISAVVVWRVVDTAEALFEVQDYEDFVAVQSEAALRNLASRHPYDSEDHEVSLRGNTAQVCEQLKHDIQERLERAGVEVIEARISHLAYASEIAAAMLQRQAAQAVVAARTKIVEGAVGMVEMALDQLAKKSIVELDDERRVAMVSNLLVVLCSDRHTQPVVNTGTLYP